jgi:hypothetical protein
MLRAYAVTYIVWHLPKSRVSTVPNATAGGKRRETPAHRTVAAA